MSRMIIVFFMLLFLSGCAGSRQVKVITQSENIWASQPKQSVTVEITGTW